MNRTRKSRPGRWRRLPPSSLAITLDGSVFASVGLYDGVDGADAAIRAVVLGQRPSTLRPLRRKGAHADLDLARGVIQIRRSHTLGDEVMDATKTFADQEVALPKSVVDVLREHVAWLDAGYPDGGTWQAAEVRSPVPVSRRQAALPVALQKPFAKVTEACGLGKSITPRAMRRTFQDLTQKAGVDGVVAMAISGHATDASRIRYSTANVPEVAKAIGKVVSIATAKPRAGKAKKAG
jgi:hypothetical protein